MRQTKSRSRNKNRNNRPNGGNIINRVFDSSGPDGKVRGTPAQIIEKYNQLHRDAQLSGDRVAAENYAQHAEYYTRILAEAQREVDRQREEQEAANRERQAERERERAERLRQQEAEANGVSDDASAELVDTPEAQSEEPKEARKPVKKRAPRKPRKQAAEAEVAVEDAGNDEAPQAENMAIIETVESPAAAE